jgi:hypothetical protein
VNGAPSGRCRSGQSLLRASCRRCRPGRLRALGAGCSDLASRALPAGRCRGGHLRFYAGRADLTNALSRRTGRGHRRDVALALAEPGAAVFPAISGAGSYRHHPLGMPCWRFDKPNFAVASRGTSAIRLPERRDGPAQRVRQCPRWSAECHYGPGARPGRRFAGRLDRCLPECRPAEMGASARLHGGRPGFAVRCSTGINLRCWAWPAGDLTPGGLGELPTQPAPLKRPDPMPNCRRPIRSTSRRFMVAGQAGDDAAAAGFMTHAAGSIA